MGRDLGEEEAGSAGRPLVARPPEKLRLTQPFHDPPLSPSHRRPQDRPYYLPNVCEVCGGPLVYAHLYSEVLAPDPRNPAAPYRMRPLTRRDPVWFDEFCCPEHPEHGQYLDLPPAELAGWEERLEESKTTRGRDLRAIQYARQVQAREARRGPPKQRRR